MRRIEVKNPTASEIETMNEPWAAVVVVKRRLRRREMEGLANTIKQLGKRSRDLDEQNEQTVDYGLGPGTGTDQERSFEYRHRVRIS